MPRKNKSSAKKTVTPEEARDRMYNYWDNVVYKHDGENWDDASKTARTLLERLDDPNSIFHDDEFLHKIIDDMENDKKVKNTRFISKEGEGDEQEKNP